MSSESPAGITNRQRVEYILDVLAEQFPTKAKLLSCACGSKAGEKPTLDSSGQVLAAVENGVLPSKRDLIEGALLDALKREGKQLQATSLQKALEGMNDEEIGNLIRFAPVSPTFSGAFCF